RRSEEKVAGSPSTLVASGYPNTCQLCCLSSYRTFPCRRPSSSQLHTFDRVFWSGPVIAMVHPPYSQVVTMSAALPGHLPAVSQLRWSYVTPYSHSRVRPEKAVNIGSFVPFRGRHSSLALA